jgi:hypothetical protein
VALGVVAAERAERQQLPLLLDAFRHDDEAGRMPELDRRLDDRSARGVLWPDRR